MKIGCGALTLSHQDENTNQKLCEGKAAFRGGRLGLIIPDDDDDSYMTYGWVCDKWKPPVKPFLPD